MYICMRCGKNTELKQIDGLLFCQECFDQYNRPWIDNSTIDKDSNNEDGDESSDLKDEPKCTGGCSI